MSFLSRFFRSSLLGLLFAVFLLQAVAVGQESIKIGVVLSSSGAASKWGQHARNGLLIALDEVNETGVNGRKIELLFRDCKTNGVEAANVLNELINLDQVVAVIGDVTSTCTVPMADIANAKQVVLITPGASYPRLSKAGDYVFRYWYSDELEGSQDANYAGENLKWRKVVTLYLDAYYGQGINEVFVREFKKNHTIVEQIPFKQYQTDFSREISRIRSLQPDGIFLVGYINETTEILRQLKRANLTPSPQILSTQPFHIFDIIEKAEGAAEGVYFSVPRRPLQTNKISQDFESAYQKRYGQDIISRPAEFAASAYDSLRILVDALKRVETSGGELRATLQETRNFSGAAFGPINFDPFGDIGGREFEVKQVRSNSFVGVEQIASPSRIGEPPTPEENFFYKNKELIAAIVGVLPFILGWLGHKFFLSVWKFFQWRWLKTIWFWKARLSTRNRDIVTLGDYVSLLERQRNAIVKKCNNLKNAKKTTIYIYSYTMQLPRDWPLWETDFEEAKQSPTPLEQYFINFKNFLPGSEAKYDVRLRRVIVIDSCDSPRGIARMKELEEDVKKPYFEKYIEILHRESSEACFYPHRRPWPGWLTDSVFYGIQEPEQALKWLWGVTTSYNAGEDLIILRLHKLGGRGLGKAKRLARPFALQSLDDLATMADKLMTTQPLSSLREKVVKAPQDQKDQEAPKSSASSKVAIPQEASTEKGEKDSETAASK